MSLAPVPQWLIPPEDGFTAAGVHRRVVTVDQPYAVSIDFTEVDRL